jgi:lipopolysaccharide transport system ATP-binding protein
MSDIVIRVEGIGKKYHIGAVQTRYRTLRDKLADALAAPLRRAKKLLRGQATGAAELDEVIWALKDISFEVARGEVVGIIGRNGAGKSTLLKVLSRITEPTEGYAEIHGRVGSLLEVGTGFHPELTGRENIFLNGAILGMSRSEIERRFDEIVGFAEIEKFIDTPVKHYSSGMYVRLAFAVAAHLEPEILVVDEVLSVGDASFQRKCLGRMSDVARSGRTVLFVSHNMGAITDLCERVILLEDGRIKLEGDPTQVVAAYLSSGAEASGIWSRPAADDHGEDRDVLFTRVRILSGDGEQVAIVPFNEPFQVELSYRITRPVRDLAVLFGIQDQLGNLLWTSYDTDTTGLGGHSREPGRYLSTCRVPAGWLRPGQYYVNVSAHIPGIQIFDSHAQLLAFDVSHAGYVFDARRPGAMTPVLEWTVRQNGDLRPVSAGSRESGEDRA